MCDKCLFEMERDAFIYLTFLIRPMSVYLQFFSLFLITSLLLSFWIPLLRQLPFIYSLCLSTAFNIFLTHCRQSLFICCSFHIYYPSTDYFRGYVPTVCLSTVFSVFLPTSLMFVFVQFSFLAMSLSFV